MAFNGLKKPTGENVYFKNTEPYREAKQKSP